MIQKITNQDFYHVNRVCKQNLEIPLKTGNTLETSENYNPFFGYFDNILIRDAPTTEGDIKSFPAIKFVELAGQSNLGQEEQQRIIIDAASIAQHYFKLSRELILEETRINIDQNAPSRKTCLWLTDSLNEAIAWQNTLGGPNWIVRVNVSGTIHRADSNFLPVESEPISMSYEKARAYWLGQRSDDPKMEILFHGKGTVVEVMAD